MPASLRKVTVPPALRFAAVLAAAGWAAACLLSTPGFAEVGSAAPGGHHSAAQAGPALRETAAASRATQALAARDLQAEVSAWLRDELGLAVVPVAPAIVFVPDDRIADLRVHDGAAEGPHAEGTDVLAVYDDDARTIYLRESWRADPSVGGAILVHETVHHIQNVSGETFACPEAREAAAFDLQERWLRRFGDSLDGAFGIDGLTVLALGMCGW